ncbi:MAG: malonyl-ACP O-methyltransferase BioC [Pseudomonadota bacterium]|nr:malonyl-ACP O-methyltransferase BioC [Pseudomonadota bacterium]
MKASSHLAEAYALDKRDIAKSFSRAAHSYDSVAGLQRQVGSALLALLPICFRPARTLDLGSGTGYFSACLSRRFGGQTLALDIAPGMLEYARSQRPMADLLWICADAERLPLASGSLDLVFSCLALQWCNGLEVALKEVARTLAPDGLFALATLLPGTLCELEQAWRGVDDGVHVNRFLPAHEVERAVSTSGLKPVQTIQRRWVMHYPDTPALLHALKALGAHNVNAGRSHGLGGRRTLAALSQGYERLREPDGLPARYQVYLTLLQRRTG